MFLSNHALPPFGTAFTGLLESKIGLTSAGHRSSKSGGFWLSRDIVIPLLTADFLALAIGYMWHLAFFYFHRPYSKGYFVKLSS